MLRRNHLAGGIICSEVNLNYLMGFPCDHAVLLVQDRSWTFWTDFRYLEVARRDLPKEVTVQPLRGNRAQLLAAIAQRLPKGARVGIEDALPIGEVGEFLSIVGVGGYESISRILAQMRGVKSREELARIEASARLNDAIFLEALNTDWRGLSEVEIATLIKGGMLARGVKESFETIVAVGAVASECHHICQHDHRVQSPTSVLVDMGVLYQGYCSDMTRCVSFGKPSALYKKVYQTVLNANEAALEAIRPGVRCCDIDAVAREVITRAGYGRAFGHSLGHSVGLEIHETPAFSTHSETVLEPGMVITVEPGIYLPGKLGVRIEDLIVVTKDGCRILTQTPKDLLII